MRRRIYFWLCFLLVVAFTQAQDNPATLDEFEELNGDSLVTTISSPISTETPKNSTPANIYWTSAVLLATAGASIFLRFKSTRQLRSLFLVLSIVILGFYRGGCPCSIQSFQNGILGLTGTHVKWHSVLLFAGLIPITYLFGRVYCGWICHLGALQEFIFKTSSVKLFQSERSQKMMRGIRITALIFLLAQLLITQTNLYKKVDPFATIYNFHSEYAVSWVLVVVVIASSFFLYRPFCKTACPVGLVLGWINKIPGASVLGVQHNCNSCALCNKECVINAITRDNKTSVLDNQECIRCGECIKACKKKAFGFFRKNKNHPSKIECKPISLTAV